jgi:hypothetical protein
VNDGIYAPAGGKTISHSMSGWLNTESRRPRDSYGVVGGEDGEPRTRRLAVLAAMKAMYANLVDPLLTQERVDAMLRELAEDVLASEGLESFLTVTTPEGGTPTVITVSRLSRFRSGMGQTSPYDGNGYGFL